MTLTPDAAAYLALSAEEIAREEGFTPATPAAMKAWIERNVRAIAERAMAMQSDFVAKILGDDEVMTVAAAHLSERVYERARQAAHAPCLNPRYVAYAKAHRLTPEEMKAKDGGNMANFLCWNR